MNSKFRRSSYKKDFARIPGPRVSRSRFNLSHTLKTTFDAGYLIPILAEEALPGDTFNLKLHAFSRMSTPIFPIMDNLYMDTFFFAVPKRLLWSNWEKFNGAQDKPSDSTDFTTPKLAPTDVGGYAVRSIHDYLGLPINKGPVAPVAFWHRAYNLIWNEWFRDQNLQDPVPEHVDDGPDPLASYNLLKRGKRHDYFTSCLPFPQKGSEVQVELLGKAPVKGIGVDPTSGWTAGPVEVKETGETALTQFQSYQNLNVDLSAFGQRVVEDPDNAGYPGIYADLASVSGIDINELRRGFALQSLFERDARGGTRYTELLRSHFGVVSPDARLQRPEFLGGGTSMVNVAPIAQTSGTGTYTETPQGTLAAMATCHINGHGFTKSFTEHCVVLGLVMVRADLTYQQGVHRKFTRNTRFDYFWPAFANLGEQTVYNGEIFLTGTDVDNNAFGYQERYAEYRYSPSRVTGVFRSTAPDTLDSWHLAQNFTDTPVLGSTFIQENVPMSRILATPTDPHFIFDGFYDFVAARPMPVFGVPGTLRF